MFCNVLLTDHTKPYFFLSQISFLIVIHEGSSFFFPDRDLVSISSFELKEEEEGNKSPVLTTIP